MMNKKSKQQQGSKPAQAAQRNGVAGTNGPHNGTAGAHVTPGQPGPAPPSMDGAPPRSPLTNGHAEAASNGKRSLFARLGDAIGGLTQARPDVPPVEDAALQAPPKDEWALEELAKQADKARRRFERAEAKLQEQAAANEKKLQADAAEVDALWRDAKEQCKGTAALHDKARQEAEALAQERAQLAERMLQLASQQEEHQLQVAARQQELEAAAEQERQTIAVERRNMEHEIAAERRRAEAAALEERLLLLKEVERIQHWERDLRQREDNAAAGFVRENEEALRVHAEAVARARAKLAELNAEREADRDAWERERIERQRRLAAEQRQQREALRAELQRLRTESQATLEQQQQAARRELQGERQAIAAERAQIAEERARLRKEQGALAVDKELLADDREILDQEIARRAQAQIDGLENQLRAHEQSLAAAREERERLRGLLEQRGEADRRFGHLSPEDVLSKLQGLEAERDRLQRELAGRPAGEAQRLRELEAQQASWDDERAGLKLRVQQLSEQLGRSRVGVGELERVREERDVLQTQSELYKKYLQDLRAEVQQLTGKSDGKATFSALAQYDADEKLQAQTPVVSEIGDLRGFVRDLRHRIAGQRLFYEERELRLFLGGLSMSRLHILQGISGTGKTSLPRAFAEAIGGDFTSVAVQAGWRDRHDLLGHYNAFEERYHETECLKGLYRAGTPACADRICVVLLDEINLSRPEHYLADLLSELEQPAEQRRLTLMAGRAPRPPRLLEDFKLPLRPNVWFVGTANHDESTVGFADKTYDRAHVMELPVQHRPYSVAAPPPREPISFRGMCAAFDRAKAAYQKDAEVVARFFNDRLARPLREGFRIGWGNRLIGRQIPDFVPVVLAAGGSVGEAADHLLHSKILRHLKERHDLQREALDQVESILEKLWGAELDAKDPPERSLQLLRDERRRLGIEVRREGG